MDRPREQARYPKYLAAAKPASGANFVGRGGDYDVMEANGRNRKFCRSQDAKACYDSPEHSAAKIIPQKYPDAEFIIVATAPADAYCLPNCVACSMRAKRSSDRIASASWSARPFRTGRASVRNFCCIATASGNEVGSPEGSA